MTNTNQLYVANLPPGTTEDAVRRHFATCGGVADVELAPEHGGGRAARGHARVTMTSPAYAAAAVGRLDRASFEGKVLRVSDSPIQAERPPASTVKIVQQFRERGNMAYELDCAGAPLTVRVFPLEKEEWRVALRCSDAVEAVVATASAATRRGALEAALREWNARASSTPAVDTEDLLQALSAVRAI